MAHRNLPFGGAAALGADVGQVDIDGFELNVPSPLSECLGHILTIGYFDHEKAGMQVDGIVSDYDANVKYGLDQ